MPKIIFLLLLGIASHLSAATLSFAPPEGWKKTEESQLSSRVKIMVVGTSLKGFPPSLNLATEVYSGTLPSYLKIVKSINQSKGNTWKNLGSIATKAGIGNLSQVDAKTKWGNLRMMHAIVLKEGVVYILTATALADEFAGLYDAFFKAFKSLTILPEDVDSDSSLHSTKKTIAEKDAHMQ